MPTLIMEPSRLSISEAIQAQTGRFRVVEGSPHGHCCVEYSVVDMHRAETPGMDELVCECFDIADAAALCNLLNEKHATVNNAQLVQFTTLVKH